MIAVNNQDGNRISLRSTTPISRSTAPRAVKTHIKISIPPKKQHAPRSGAIIVARISLALANIVALPPWSGAIALCLLTKTASLHPPLAALRRFCPPATRFRFFNVCHCSTLVLRCIFGKEPPSAGCGSPVEISAAGRSTDRAGRRERLTEPRYEVTIPPVNGARRRATEGYIYAAAALRCRATAISLRSPLSALRSGTAQGAVLRKVTFTPQRH